MGPSTGFMATFLQNWSLNGLIIIIIIIKTVLLELGTKFHNQYLCNWTKLCLLKKINFKAKVFLNFFYYEIICVRPLLALFRLRRHDETRAAAVWAVCVDKLSGPVSSELVPERVPQLGVRKPHPAVSQRAAVCGELRRHLNPDEAAGAARIRHPGEERSGKSGGEIQVRDPGNPGERSGWEIRGIRKRDPGHPGEERSGQSGWGGF